MRWTAASVSMGLSVLYLLIPTLLLLLVAILSVRAWRRPAAFRTVPWAGAALLAFVALDGGLAAALPRLGKSFGPVAPTVVYLFFIRLGFYFLLLLAGLLAEVRRLRRPGLRRSAAGLLLFWLLHFVLLAGVVDAFYVEPFALRLTERDIAAPGLSGPLRIVHLSDLHVERTTSRERNALALVQQLQPDLILLSGDYLNLAYLDDPLARRDTRDFLAQLHAPYGVYAVAGTVDMPDTMHDLFDGLEIAVLDDAVVRLPVGGKDLYLVGVSNRGHARDEAALRLLMGQVPAGAYTLLLYHTPDLAELAAETGVDLYLAGHTHGGQVRLPIYGAVITNSAYGKRYEGGLYSVGPMALYVSRGLGMEGYWFTPRARFLCPPEVVLLELGP